MLHRVRCGKWDKLAGFADSSGHGFARSTAGPAAPWIRNPPCVDYPHRQRTTVLARNTKRDLLHETLQYDRGRHPCMMAIRFVDPTRVLAQCSFSATGAVCDWSQHSLPSNSAPCSRNKGAIFS